MLKSANVAFRPQRVEFVVAERGVPLPCRAAAGRGVRPGRVTAAAADPCYAAAMPPTLTHIALQVRNLDACVAFYGDFCGMAVVHRRGADRVVWLAEPGRETEFIIVLLSGGRGAGQADDDYGHLGFAVARNATGSPRATSCTKPRLRGIFCCSDSRGLPSAPASPKSTASRAAPPRLHPEGRKGWAATDSETV